MCLECIQYFSYLEFRFTRTCDLDGSCDPKIDILKSCNFVGIKPTGFENSLRFALSPTVSKITAIYVFEVM